MDIRPILSTLLRHKTAAGLIVLEVALSCAIICNAVFLISNRLERMQRATGIADAEIVRILVAGIGDDENADALVKQDIAALRSLPGVKAATSLNQIPFDNSSWNSSVSVQPQQPMPNLNSTVYLGENLVGTLGLRIVEGRDFNPDEYVNWSEFNATNSKVTIPAVILTRDVAQKLFPGESAVGKNIYSWNRGDVPHRVVGVVEKLIRPNDNGGPAESGYSIMLSVSGMTGRFVLRTDPARRAEVQKAAVAALERNSARRIILRQDPFTDVIAKYYRQDRAMAWLLVAVIVALLVVTALGIVGLASFWVQQRTKQIGVRRALGATRAQILRYFQTENFLLATFGIILGMIAAYGINQLLMGHYELPRLPLVYLPVGAVALWLLGQIAVYGPARRAAAIPPAVATRSV